MNTEDYFLEFLQLLIGFLMGENGGSYVATEFVVDGHE